MDTRDMLTERTHVKMHAAEKDKFSMESLVCHIFKKSQIQKQSRKAVAGAEVWKQQEQAG